MLAQDDFLHYSVDVIHQLDILFFIVGKEVIVELAQALEQVHVRIGPAERVHFAPGNTVDQPGPRLWWLILKNFLPFSRLFWKSIEPVELGTMLHRTTKNSLGRHIHR